MAGKKKHINYLNILWTGMLWILCCIPVVTLMASSMAAYNTVNEVLKGSDEGIAEEFFSGFRRYLKRWMLFFLPDALIVAWLIYIIIYLRDHGNGDAADTLLLATVYAISAVVLAINLCLTACGGRFGDGPVQLIKLSLFCAFSHPLRSAAAVAVTVMMAAAVVYCIPLIVIMPAALWFFQCLIWNGALKFYSIGYDEDEDQDDDEEHPDEDIIEDNDEYTVIRLGRLVIRKRKKAGRMITDDDGYEDTVDIPKDRGDRVVPKSEVDNAD